MDYPMNKYLGIILGLLAIAINFLMGVFPVIVDTIYYKYVFQLIRLCYDHTLGLIPIPMIYILFIILIWKISNILKCVWNVLTTDQRLFYRFTSSVNIVLNTMGWIIFSFYFLWGWNYQRTPFESRMSLKPVEADTTFLLQETTRVLKDLEKLRTEIKPDSISFKDHDIPNNLESHLRTVQETMISTWNEPTMGRVRIRKIKPRGTLLRISTAGVYIPFVCEGHVDDGLHPLQLPFTMAHEMAHGYGYTDEGVCNFIGYMTCLNSDIKMIRYSGILGYWRYLLSNLRSEARYSYGIFRPQVSQAIDRDLNDMALQMAKFPDIMPNLRNAVYDTYLKSHGVKKGIANYNDIVRLVSQWKLKNSEANSIQNQRNR